MTSAAALFEVKSGVRPLKLRKISEEKLTEFLSEIREKLDEGLFGERVTDNFSAAPDKPSSNFSRISDKKFR